MNESASLPRFFHPGEVKIQAESGTDTRQYEAMSAEMMLPALKENEVRFVEARTFSAAVSIDSDIRPWASVLFANGGSPLFRVESPTVVQVAAPLANGDPLVENINGQGKLGVLYFDPSRRRRSKSMGTARLNNDGAIRYEMTRNFGLCPKYIFKREHQPAAPAAEPIPAGTSTALDTADRTQLEAADTLFLASYYPGHGVDATHRGGASGFVTVLDTSTIEMPDYFGNGMFNTFGNLVLDPRLGMTTVDFATGRTIQMTGHATVRANENPHVRAERILTLNIDEVIVTSANAGTWTDLEPSPHNPPVP